MSVNVMKVIKMNRPALIDRVEKMRADGKSYDVIARYVTKQAGVTVGRESIRMWFKRLEGADTNATSEAD